MRKCFADYAHDGKDFWGKSHNEFFTDILKEGYCIGYTPSEMEELFLWAEEAFFILRAKKYTKDNFLNICIAAVRGDEVVMIFGGASVSTQKLGFCRPDYAGINRHQA